MKGNALFLLSGNSDVEFAKRVADQSSAPLFLPDSYREGAKPGHDAPMLRWFSNSNLMVTIPQNVRGSDCFIIQTQVPPVNGTRPPVSDHLLEVFLMADALKNECSVNRVFVVFPYMPYSRSDKKDRPRRGIGLKWLARMLKKSEVDGILVMDPHCGSYIHSIIDIKVEVLRAKPLFLHYMFKNLDYANAVAVAPDSNSGKNIGNIASTLNIPIAYIDKRRTGDDEKARPVGIVGEVRGKICIIVDDETLSGSTLEEAASFCFRQGAMGAYVFVTFTFLSDPVKVKKFADSPAILGFVTTDAVPISPKVIELLGPKLTIIPVAGSFSRAIQLMHNEDSVQQYKATLYDGLPSIGDIHDA